jgi:hypothetical protein
MPGVKKLIIIGINKYDDPYWPQLRSAVEDVDEIKRVLTDRYGFISEQISEQAATRKTIQDKLEELAAELSSDDSLIIYFAGHGHQKSKGEEGFWVPKDASGTTKSGLISNATILDYIRDIKAKHILLISDSCFSGSLLMKYQETDVDASIEELEGLSSRYIFTSGGEQKVADGQDEERSPFCASMLEFLETNRSANVKANELFAAVKLKVATKFPSQTVLARVLSNSDHRNGQMIFRLKAELIRESIQEKKLLFPLPPADDPHFIISRRLIKLDNENNQIHFSHLSTPTYRLLELLETERRIVLVGAPGSGKTVELRQLAKKLKDPRNDFVPIYLRFYGYQGGSIADFIPTDWRTVPPQRLVIIIDGLDEVSPDKYNNAIKELAFFGEANPDVLIVVSCRINFYLLPYDNTTGEIPNFKVYMIRDLTKNEIQEYLNQHEIHNLDLFNRINHDSSLEILLKTPIILSLLVNSFDDNLLTAILAGKSQIMEKVLRMQFKITLKENGFGSKYFSDEEHIFSCLEKLAFVMEVMGRNFLLETEISEVYTSEQELSSIKLLSSIIRSTHKGAEWTFVHKSIQEYLISRFLFKLSFPQLLNLIRITGKEKLKPQWANALSFLFTMGPAPLISALEEWLIDHDIEFVLKFEPSRISDTVRTKISKEIIEYYIREQIWITNSNKLSVLEFGRFAALPEVLNIILSLLTDNTSSNITITNLIVILEFLQLDHNWGYNDRLRETLKLLLLKPDSNDFLTYAIMRVLGSHKLCDQTMLDWLIDRFRNDQNAYVRAGLYKVIIDAGVENKYVDILLDGLNLNRIKSPIGMRSDTHLMDENMFLTQGLKNISSTSGIKKLLAFYEFPYHGKDVTWSDLIEITDSVILNALKINNSKEAFYDNFLSIYKESGIGSDDRLTKVLATYFSQTSTSLLAIKFLWLEKTISDWEKTNLIAQLLNTELLCGILEEYVRGEWTREQIIMLHSLICQKETSISGWDAFAKMIEAAVLSKESLDLRPVKSPDSGSFKQERLQRSFDILFSNGQFVGQIKSAYDKHGYAQLNRDELLALYKSNNDPDDHILESALRWIHEQFFSHKILSEEAALQSLLSPAFKYYKLTEIYRYMGGYRGYHVSTTLLQIQEAERMCEQYTEQYDIEEEILQDTDLSKGIWFFLTHHNPKIANEKLLAYTLQYDTSIQDNLSGIGAIDLLETKLSADLVETQVVKNLNRHDITALPWINNAAYAIRKKIPRTKQILESYLVATIDNDYKFIKILELWWSETKDSHLLKSLMNSAHDQSIRKGALRLLLDSIEDRGYVIQHLITILNNSSEYIGNRTYAASQLMYLGELRGLIFITKYILSMPSIGTSYAYEMRKASNIKTPDAIIYLLQLLYAACKAEPHMKNDFFKSEITTVISQIGTLNRYNFTVTKEHIEHFLDENKDMLNDINFLKINLNRMEAYLDQEESKNRSLEQALQDYSKAIKP